MSFNLAKHVFAPGEGEVLVMHPPIAGKITILVDPTNTGETSLCTLIQTLDPGAAVPVHRHDMAEQVLFFFTGRGATLIAGEEVDARPGTTVHVPKGIEHGITNTGNEPLSFLETTSPPGFQETFRKLSQLSKPTPEDVARIAAEHDILIDPDGSA
ncbi:MAG: cupin domain-containing protein [Myxococcales bacterium]|jgi:mannose-6-phosphate isomerase-like protein (cupin superfamily)|nr:MAG: cupin domain-containing protein [Myxococcales bacterium]